jgi:SAM-dependent methyltransferase
MEKRNCAGLCTTVSKCDIFDFMAKHVGMTVIHPGGFAATRKLIKALGVNRNSRVIDIACGKGTTAILLAEEFGCQVVGIDLAPELIDEAVRLTKKKGLGDRMTFRVADALSLPFDQAEFDIAISQAMLVLIEDKIKAIQEARRVIKPKGFAGWLELSWRKAIPQEFIRILSDVICAYCMTNVQTFDGWRRVFHAAGIPEVSVIRLGFSPRSGGILGLFKDEGLFRSISILRNISKNPEIKARMQAIRRYFKDYEDYFACGIYYFRK